MFCAFLNFGCKKKYQEQHFLPDLEFKTSVVVVPFESWSDTSSIFGEAATLFPMEYLPAERTVIGSNIYLTYSIRWPTYGSINWQNSKLRIFLIPNDTLSFSSIEDKVSFQGQSSKMNSYLYQKSKELGIEDPVASKAVLSLSAPSLNALTSAVDSITELELLYLEQAIELGQIPKWFANTERYETMYFGARVKLGAPKLRGSILGLNEHVPEDYYDFVETLPTSNQEALLSVYYYEYLAQLTTHLFLTDSMKELSGESRSNILYDKKKEYFKILPEPISDYCLMYMLSRIIQNDFSVSTDVINSSIDLISDDNNRNHIQDMRRKHQEEVLTPGIVFPTISLPDINSQLVDLKRMQGKVILISFWATWCKPCIQEFQFENKLKSELNSEDFELVSICLGSNEEQWHKVLKTHPLQAINLFAGEDEQKKLYDIYKIRALPHYTLMDRKGRLIENNTLRPSDKNLRNKIDLAIERD